jgi:ubiquinone/menaquinone biosynthesis C-methylase UbiE
MERISVPELLDSDAGTPKEIADSLEDLRRINRFLGGYSTTRSLLRRVMQEKQRASISYLDVGAASSAPADGVEVTAIDRAPAHLVNSKARRVCGNAFHLPFRDDSFDVCGSSLLLHHLEPEQIGDFLRESLRVARLAVVVNDIRRSGFHFLFSQLGRVIYKSRITAFDAPASVRRAYTANEIAATLSAQGFSAEISQYFFFRFGVIIWK